MTKVRRAGVAPLSRKKPRSDAPRVGRVNLEPHARRAILRIVVVRLRANRRHSTPPTISHGAEPVAARLALDHVGADFRTCPAPLLLWTFARVRSVWLLLCLVVVLCEGVLGCPLGGHRAR